VTTSAGSAVSGIILFELTRHLNQLPVWRKFYAFYVTKLILVLIRLNNCAILLGHHIYEPFQLWDFLNEWTFLGVIYV
jgi:hypothetical protein